MVTSSRGRRAGILVVCSLLWAGLILPLAGATVQPDGLGGGSPAAAAVAQAEGRRLVVELSAPSLVERAGREPGAFARAAGRLDVRSSAASQYADRLRADQDAFLLRVAGVLPSVSQATYIDEAGRRVPHSYTVLFNGVAVDPGDADPEAVRAALSVIPGVKAVYRERSHAPDLYSGVPLVGAPTIWANPAIGGSSKAGAGVKFASVDGGVHHDAPMFKGTGYSYPPDIPSPGLGDPANNNGKIVASRAYFRAWDPPVEGDGNVWPGTQGTSHGVHTSGIAVGGSVNAAYLGTTVSISGVAPKAWVMSYRVFYTSVNGNVSMWDPEGIAALEDVVKDGAQVVNNSWGSGPLSEGGEYDPLDMALTRAAQAGVFVCMSNGNSGPGSGTGDHPGPEYINVASGTTGSYMASFLDVTAPAPVGDDLKNIQFSLASFGGAAPFGQPTTYELVTADSMGSVEGCGEWGGGYLSGKAVLIRRGTCDYSVKALNAQNAGAALVIVYNSQAGGDSLLTMGVGAVGGSVTIPAIFVGYTSGTAMEGWFRAKGSACRVTLSGSVQKMGVQPDVLAPSSSRGPGVGNVLKPDIAAPGVNVLSQGYTYGATGEARHLGYGQASGTSMAAPFVTGAAALLRQIHPLWPNAWVKSALMSTSKYLDIFTSDGKAAQPLDMGAGRLDLTHAADPGVILEPPGLSFGKMAKNATRSVVVRVTSVSSQAETYETSTLFTGNGFAGTTPMHGVTVSPASLTLAAGATGLLTVTFDASAAGVGTGENQGFVVLKSSGHEAHMPAWARVMPLTGGKVLLLDNDGSATQGIADYSPYYKAVMAEIGRAYDYVDMDALRGQANTVPPVGDMLGYGAVVYFSGDNSQGYGNGGMPPSTTDMNRLQDFINSGGSLVAMGQNMASLMAALNSSSAPPLYSFGMGGQYLQDSVTAGGQPAFSIVAADGAPQAFADFSVDVGATASGGAHNLSSIDEIDPKGTSTTPYWKLFRYPGSSNKSEGVVAMAHRDNPTLERPGATFSGRCVYATFGIEGVNSGGTATSRGQLMRALLDWAADSPNAVIRDKRPGSGPTVSRQFEAVFSSPVQGCTPVSYRWDFGDGSAFSGPYYAATVAKTYVKPGTYAVRVEVLDSFGNRTIGELAVRVVEGVWFPRLGYVPGQTTEGFGFVNPGQSGANLTFTAYGAGGQQIGASPSPINWGAGKQAALQAENPALLGLKGEAHGWVSVKSDASGMLGFFQSQLYDARGLVGMDGAPMATATTADGYFPRAASSGGYMTEITVANPGASPVQVTLTGYDGTAAHAGGTHAIPARGALIADMATIFPVAFNGCVQVASTGGVIGNARVKYQGEAVSSVNLAPLSGASTTLFAPHVTAWPGLFFTEITLVNPNAKAARPVLTLSTSAGQPLGGPVQVEIPARQVARLSGLEMGLPAGQTIDAWLAVDGGDTPLLGSVTFGNPDTHRYESTLPLQPGGTTEYYFAQVATGNIFGVVYATGVAIVNPSSEEAVEVAIAVHMSDGTVNGNVVTRTLQPGEKYVKQIDQIEGIGQLANQAGGYLHLVAKGPVLAFELFYDSALNFLSAVEGQY